MFQALSLIVSVYVLARLIQVPIEHGNSKDKPAYLWIISVPAIAAIAWLASLILGSSVDTPTQP